MKRQTIAGRLREAREIAGLSQEEVGKRLGKSQSAISDYERGRLGLQLPGLVELAKILEQPLSFFLDEETTDLQHRAEGELRRARKIMETALEHLQVPPPGSEPVKWVPLIAEVNAGEISDTWACEYVPVPLSVVGTEDVFAVEVLGDSMIGRGIRTGDRIIVDPLRSAYDGDIVMAQRNDEKVIRIYREDEDGVYLIAAARGYPRLRLKEATIIGVVTGWFRRNENNT